VLAALRNPHILAYRRRNTELMAESLQAQSEASSYQVQMLDGIETLKPGGRNTAPWSAGTNLFMRSTNVSVERGRLGALIDASLGRSE
jgi:hypothetical protein